MTNHILPILAISCGAIIWVKALPFMYYIKRSKFIIILHATISVLRGHKEVPQSIRLKPFDCESCLAFWGTFSYALTITTWSQALCLGAVNYIFTALLSKLV